MTKRTQNQYSPEFRESAVKLALESDRPVSETATELGISKSTLHTWISKYSQPKSSNTMSTDQHLYEELKRLKKENARLKEERDILKKAAKYFANETR